MKLKLYLIVKRNYCYFPIAKEKITIKVQKNKLKRVTII